MYKLKSSLQARIAALALDDRWSYIEYVLTTTFSGSLNYSGIVCFYLYCLYLIPMLKISHRQKQGLVALQGGYALMTDGATSGMFFRESELLGDSLLFLLLSYSYAENQPQTRTRIPRHYTKGLCRGYGG